MKRRLFLNRSLATGGALLSANALLANPEKWINNLAASNQFELPKLGYAYDALEPYIDAQTMEIHYTKHHAGYVKKLNEAVEKNPALKNKSLEDICKVVSKYDPAVRNNAGGHYNHSMFWKILSKDGGKPSASLEKQINADFGTMDKFKSAFEEAAKTRFGSGWAWLLYDGKKLAITSTPNQDNPIMDDAKIKGTPLVGLDVWEHAYYLKYQNKRPDYVSAFWSVLNWNEVNKNWEKLTKK
jgi:Fe-Mn family superoxide dismutase